MKPGRNEACPCGSGKKFKRCCMDQISQQHAALLDEAEQIVAMNPNLTLDELNVVMQQHTSRLNNTPLADFCGLSPNQMQSWMSGHFDAWQTFQIAVPEALQASPVMRYLALMLDEAQRNDGVIKTTAKGNLSAGLVKTASALLPEFAVAALNTPICISEFAGINEDKFNALHYTRILAELSGITYTRKGQLQVKKAALAQYEKQGVAAFFKPMLQAMLQNYNWAYLDGYEQDVDLRPFWIFMLWRLSEHQNLQRLTEEMITAFPPLLQQIHPVSYASAEQMLHLLIESRFIARFLQFWGFVTLDRRRQTLPPAVGGETTAVETTASETTAVETSAVETSALKTTALKTSAVEANPTATAFNPMRGATITLQPLFRQSFHFFANHSLNK